MRHHEGAVVTCMSWRVQTTNTKVTNRHSFDVMHGVFWFKPWNTIDLEVSAPHSHLVPSGSQPLKVAPHMVLVLVSAKNMAKSGIILRFKLADNFA